MKVQFSRSHWIQPPIHYLAVADRLPWRQFKDDFARSTRGSDAAQKLTDAVKSYLHTKEIDTRDVAIVVLSTWIFGLWRLSILD